MSARVSARHAVRELSAASDSSCSRAIVYIKLLLHFHTSGACKTKNVCANRKSGTSEEPGLLAICLSSGMSLLCMAFLAWRCNKLRAAQPAKTPQRVPDDGDVVDIEVTDTSTWANPSPPAIEDAAAASTGALSDAQPSSAWTRPPGASACYHVLKK